MRQLGAVRLSRLTDETTSPERQREQITLTAQARGDSLVKIVEDLDVSGAVSAWNRDLAPYLTDPELIKSYDGIIVAKLDRLTRSLLDFQELLKWCEANGKTIVSVSEGFDLGTPVGRLIANILVMFAEFERGRMSERRAEAAAKLRGQGYWQGERPLYGYTTEKRGDRYYMVPDPEQSAVVNDMADALIAGNSMNAVARDLNERGIPGPGGSKWNRTTIRRILRSPTVNGQVVVWEKTDKKGRLAERVILGDDGMPIKRDPVIDDAKWAELLSALDVSSKTWTRRYDAAPLLNVAYCGRCHKALYGGHTTVHGKQYDYYDCSGHCGARRIPMAELHEAVDDRFVGTFGKIERTERTTIRGNNHRKELAAVGQQIASLTAERYVKGIVRGDYDALLAQLQAEYARLDALPDEPDRVKVRKLGVLVENWWPTLDAQGKRQYMLEHGIKFYAQRQPDGFVTVIAEGGGDLYEQEAALAGVTTEEYLAAQQRAITTLVHQDITR